MPSMSRKSRWKFSFRRWTTSGADSPASAADSPASAAGGGDNPPMSFICPISSRLMYDPVIVPSGQTFERACIEACRELNFVPPPSRSSPSSSSDSLSNPNSSSTGSCSFPLFFIPNAALQSAIVDWCDRLALPRPSPISPDSARSLVQNLISNSPNPPTPNPTVKTLTDTTTTSSFSSSSSSEINLTTSSTSSSSSDDPKMAVDPGPGPDPLEESILAKLRSPQVAVKESGLIALRHSARDGGPRCRVSLCTPSILAAITPLAVSSSTQLQVHATAALVNLSIDPPANKVKIVRSGAVPALVEALKLPCEEARYNAAGALLSLALEDENKLAIGVLGAIPPLVRLFCQESAGRVARGEAGMALYHLSLASINLSKIAKTPGAVRAMLGVATARDVAVEETTVRLQRVAMMVLASLARRKEGRVALMDADAVKAMVGLMEEERAGGGREGEYCLGVLYEMSKGSLRFRASAKAAGAERVLLQLVAASTAAPAERGEVAREMARRILKGMRGDQIQGGTRTALMNEEGEADEEEIGSVVSDGLVSFRRRRFDDFGAAGGSASNSANF